MSDAEKSGFITRLTGPKKRWRAYKARVGELPENYRTVVEAVEKYLMHFVPAEGGSTESMLEDLVDLFEQSAENGTPVREVVGQEPVEFAEAFVRNYSQGGYVPPRVRKQLTDAVARAEEAEKKDEEEGGKGA